MGSREIFLIFFFFSPKMRETEHFYGDRANPLEKENLTMWERKGGGNLLIDNL